MSEKESSYSTVQTTENRDRVIVRTSVIGILANLFLAAFKAAVGLLSHSIAVVLDAVNNLSDALSSVITIIGTKLAGKKPDKKHPLGYGRIEYLSALIVSAFVLYAGITALVESVKKIIHPEAADYSAAGLVIVASAVIVKLLLGRYVKATGEKVNSGALIASGSDAVSDAALSLSVFISGDRIRSNIQTVCKFLLLPPFSHPQFSDSIHLNRPLMNVSKVYNKRAFFLSIYPKSVF